MREETEKGKKGGTDRKWGGREKEKGGKGRKVGGGGAGIYIHWLKGYPVSIFSPKR